MVEERVGNLVEVVVGVLHVCRGEQKQDRHDEVDMNLRRRLLRRLGGFARSSLSATQSRAGVIITWRAVMSTISWSRPSRRIGAGGLMTSARVSQD